MTAADSLTRLGEACAVAVAALRTPAAAGIVEGGFAVLDPRGRAVAEAMTSPAMCGVIAACAGALLARFPAPGLAEATLLVTNDPYAGGIDSGKLFLFRPLLAEGRLAGLAGSVAAHADFGAMRGDAATFGREITHEGFRLPPLALRSPGGGFPPVLTAMVAANVRDGAATLRLMEAQRTALFALASAVGDPAPLEGLGDGLAATAAARLAQQRPARLRSRPSDAQGLPAQGQPAEGQPAQGQPALAGQPVARLEIGGGAIVLGLEGGRPPGDDDGHCSLTASRAAALAVLSRRLAAPPLEIAALLSLEPPANARFAAVYPLGVANWALASAAIEKAVDAAFEDASARP